jgi:flavin reductase (DIM6/NTAB) family NADH-FMN oxidoreductase RutF
MGRLSGGVTVVTARDAEGRPRGLTATAVCSVSLDPPLVLVCTSRDSVTGDAILFSGRYGLNLLAAPDRERSERFATPGEGKFEGIEWREGPGLVPWLGGCLACLECEVEQTLEAGDHMIVVGRVVEVSLGAEDGDPLVYFRGRYRALGSEIP